MWMKGCWKFKNSVDSFLEFSFTIYDPVHFEVNWVSSPSSVYMWASSIAVFQETRRVSKSQRVKFYLSSIFLKNLFQLTPTLTFDFTVTIISNSSVCNNFYDGKIRFQHEGTKHYFPSNEKKDNSCKRGKGEGLLC